MRQLILAALAAVGLLGSQAISPARAQALRPFGMGSNVSPYLNLLRAGGSPAINYYGLVRPQLAYNTAINSLEQQVAASRVAITAAESMGVPTTGHQVSFLNYQRYFLNLGTVTPFQNVQATAARAGAGAGVGAATTNTSAGARALSNISYGATTPPTSGSFRRY